MRETFDEYRRELDDIAFSPGVKNELVGRLSRAAAPHRVCASCGCYGGKQIINVEA